MLLLIKITMVVVGSDTLSLSYCLTFKTLYFEVYKLFIQLLVIFWEEHVF